MRWEALFDDLEARFAALRAEELPAVVAELTRAERATVTLVGRVRASLGRELRVRVRSGETVLGELLDAGAEWLLLGAGPRRVLVPVHAVVHVRGLADLVEPEGAPPRRLGLGHALRALARDRVPVRLLAHGTVLRGRIELVGADHLELVELGEELRGPGERWTVPVAALDLVASA